MRWDQNDIIVNTYIVIPISTRAIYVVQFFILFLGNIFVNIILILVLNIFFSKMC